MQVPVNIVSLFFNKALEHPDQVALVGKNLNISFKQLDDEVRILASMYRQSGINKGDRVLVLIPMSADLYKHLLAIFYIGAIAVFLDAWVGRKRLQQCCELVECKALVGPARFRFLSFFFSSLRKIKVKLPVVPGKKYDKVCDCIIEDSYEEDTALITFTTGSTGIPKAAKRTHGFLKAQFDALIPLLKDRGEQPDMPMLPIVLLLNLGLGKTSVLADTNFRKAKKFNPEVLAKQISETKTESITASPWFILKLAEYRSAHKIFIPLKQIFTGGAPVFPDEATILLDAFPEAKITIVYGSTEAEPISHVDAEELYKQPTSEVLSRGLFVGKKDSSVEIKIIAYKTGPLTINSEEELNAISLPAGEPGELIVSGPHVLKEYWNNPEAIRENKINTGTSIWHRTGDCARIDTEGNIFLLGRAKWILNWQGKIYYPFVVEYFLKSLKGIRCGTLLMKEQMPVLFLECENDFNEYEIREILKKENLDFKIIKVKEIPKDPRHLSKIDYDRL